MLPLTNQSILIISIQISVNTKKNHFQITTVTYNIIVFIQFFCYLTINILHILLIFLFGLPLIAALFILIYKIIFFFKYMKIVLVLVKNTYIDFVYDVFRYI